MFKFYHNQISRATRSFAAGVFIVGMILIGFAMLIIALPALFAALAAGVFFLVGLSIIIYAVKLFIAANRIDKSGQDDEPYRSNVQIHYREDL